MCCFVCDVINTDGIALPNTNFDVIDIESQAACVGTRCTLLHKRIYAAKRKLFTSPKNKCTNNDVSINSEITLATDNEYYFTLNILQNYFWLNNENIYVLVDTQFELAVISRESCLFLPERPRKSLAKRSSAKSYDLSQYFVFFWIKIRLFLKKILLFFMQYVKLRESCFHTMKYRQYRPKAECREYY